MISIYYESICIAAHGFLALTHISKYLNPFPFERAYFLSISDCLFALKPNFSKQLKKNYE